MSTLDQLFNKDPIIFSSNYFSYLTEILKKINKNEIANFIEIILTAREYNNTIYFIGNGGSASTASHFVNDLTIGTNSYKKPFRCFSLCDNNSVLTAIANDFGYDEVFIRQLKILAKPKDVLVAISASGNSPNLLKAVKYANTQQIITCSLTAFDGGELKQISQHNVHVPTDLKEYGPAEDVHMILDHLINSYLNRLI